VVGKVCSVESLSLPREKVHPFSNLAGFQRRDSRANVLFQWSLNGNFSNFDEVPMQLKSKL
jgi:hypothetical protein